MSWLDSFLVQIIVLHGASVMLWIVILYLVLIIGLKGFLLWHGVHVSKRLICMKVLLPRTDSKLDQERKTEKDFREKIGVMEQFYRAIHEIRELGLKNKIRRFFFEQDKIIFELGIDKRLLSFYIITHPEYRDILEKQVTSFYTNAEVSECDFFDIKSGNKYYNGYYFHTVNKYFFPIRSYKQIENDPLNDIANVFSKFKETEKANIQIIMKPRGSGWQKKTEEFGTAFFKGEKVGKFKGIPGLGFLGTIFSALVQGDTTGMGGGAAQKGDPIIRMLASKEEIAKHIGEKANQSGFEVVIRVMAAADTETRVQEMINSVMVAFNVFRQTGSNWFQSRRIIPWDKLNRKIIGFAFKHRLNHFIEKRSLFCSEELAAIIHFPNSMYNDIPIIKWIKYKVLPPPPNMPRPEEGVLCGNNVYRNAVTPVVFKKEDRMRHHYIIGKSGSGKSVMINFLARQDIANGDGVCVVDPHGDLIEDVLCYVPKSRVKDVIVFDPADHDRPMGLNLLEAKTPEEKDMASLDAMAIFIKLFGNEIFGPRIQHYFRNGCLTLMDDEEEGATLLDVPRLFVDDEFQKYKVSKCRNAVVKQFWDNEMAKTGAREKEEMIPYFSSKFGPFISNTTMRNIIGQAKSGFNFRKCMDQQKILLINLSKGKVGDLNAQLLGLIAVSKIQMAAMGRADIPAKERKDFFLYVDEFQNFATDSFATILSEARKYRLGLIMAHQYIAQLNETHGYEKQSKVKDAVFGNVGTMMTFKLGAEDAEYFAKEYAPLLSDQDILGIANYKAYCRLNIDNMTSRPFSMDTIYDVSQANEKLAEICKKYSRLKYARKREFVDQEISARLGIKG